MGGGALCYGALEIVGLLLLLLLLQEIRGLHPAPSEFWIRPCAAAAATDGLIRITRAWRAGRGRPFYFQFL